MVTGNYQPHPTTLLFLPDPVLLQVPIRAWCPTFPKSFLETMTPVPWTLARSLYNLRVCSLTTYLILDPHTSTLPPLISIIVQSYRFSDPASTEKEIVQLFLRINGSVLR